MRPRVTIRDVMRVDPVAGVMGTADDRDDALRFAAEVSPADASADLMAEEAARFIRSRVAPKTPPPRVSYFDTFAPIEAFEVLPPAPEPTPEPPPAAPARPTKPRK